jgi:plasmid stabilization system protein ParE
VRVRLTADARVDLKLIARRIGRDNRGRAKSCSAELRGACASLSHHPARFPVAAILGGDEVRKRVHGDYLIFYRITESEVEVLRIVHGSRDWGSFVGDQ